MRQNPLTNMQKGMRSLIGIVILLFFVMGSIGCATPFDQAPISVTNQADAKQTENPSVLKVTYLDVGQADSIFIQIPGGENLLIDAGNNEDAERITSYLRNQGIRRLDVVIGTHPHEDHIGSLDKIIENFEIGQVLMPKVTTNTQTYKDVLTAIQKKGLKIKEAKAGIQLELGIKSTSTPPFTAEIIAPKANNYEDLNNYSVVIRLVYGQNSFLFTGDAEDVSEKELLNSRVDLRADVLKVGHHGSNSSTTSDFVNTVKPKFAVFSVGVDNTYGHPSASIVKRLKQSGAEVYRTDEQGTIIVESDGTKLTFKTSK